MHRVSTTVVPGSTPERIQIGAFEVNLADGVLRSKRRVLRLQDHPLQVLSALLERPGQVVTREELRRRLWPEDTFVEFDDSLNHAIHKLRDALDDSAQAPRYIETLPRRGYRLIAPVQVTDPAPPTGEAFPVILGINAKNLMVAAGLALAILTVAATVKFRRSPPPFTERDEVLIADVTNTTGEAIFDSTLKTAIAVKIGESPFLNAVSDSRVREGMQLMQKSAKPQLVGATARELCQRLNVKALLNISIARLGSHYVIALEAQDCRTGRTLARQQGEAASQDDVLTSLGQSGSRLRAQLGESIQSVRTFDRPLEEATTSSLEALQAYSLGRELQRTGDFAAAIDLYQSAVEVDPEFALAYESLGACNFDRGEMDRARDYFSRAFTLRERASEREKFIITATYYQVVTGELNKAITTYQLYELSYPRDFRAPGSLGGIYYSVGSPDKALAETQKALAVGESAGIDDNLGAFLMALNRYEEAASVLQKGIEKKLITPNVHARLYVLASVRGDAVGMQHWAAAARGTPGEAEVVFEEAEAKAFSGHLREARKLYREAARLASALNMKQLGNDALDRWALAEAEFGNRPHAQAILRETRSRSSLAGIVRARTGDIAGATSIAADLANGFPLGTIAQEIQVPRIRAAIALNRGDGAGALEALRPAAPHKLQGFLMLYLRGYALLRSVAPKEAADDFQQILDHRGINPTSPIYPLAYVGLARARAASGDLVGARKAYEEFFAIWREADPDIPILRHAKAEYAGL